MVRIRSASLGEVMAGWYKFLFEAGDEVEKSSGGSFHGWKLLSAFPTFMKRKKQKQRNGLPLRLPYTRAPPSLMDIVDKVNELCEEISEQVLSSLHDVQKSLHFWQTRAKGTDAEKLHFMVFERGPWAFFEGTAQIICGLVIKGSPVKHLTLTAASQISERVAELTTIQCYLATFLAQIHKQVYLFGERITKEFDLEAVTSLLVAIHRDMMHLEQTYNLPQNNCPVDSDGSQIPLIEFQFEALPEDLEGKSRWADPEIQRILTLIVSNTRRLNQCLSLFVSKNRRPRRAARLWLRFAGGAVGLATCSGWLLRHSKLMGSTDLDRWLEEGKVSTIAFWKDHVEQPLLSIRDELFETFRKRHRGVMEHEEVQLTANSFHRMLVAFTEQATGEKLPEGASDQEMMELVMARYEKDLTHPLQNLVGGELARALLIQVQKLKLDIETAMLELNQILRANEINFAILAALPAFFITIIIAALMQMWLVKDRGAEGKGRTARLQRRLLVVEAEKKIMQCQVLMDEGKEKNALWSFGMILYTLDRLYKVTERHAKESGEWQSLHADILDLANPKLAVHYKLHISARMVQAYECLLPSSRRLL